MRNYMIINIEGLDVAGKETLANNIANYIKEHLPKEYNHLCEHIGFKVWMHSFPTYSYSVGKKIKHILTNVPVEERNQNELDMLFAYDRLFTMSTYLKKFAEKDHMFHILIVDRYYMSNLIYSTAAAIKKGVKFEETDDKTVADSIITNTNSGWQYIVEQKALPRPDVMYMIYRQTEEGTNKHRELIASKAEVDLNETDEFQSTLNSVISDYLVPHINQFMMYGTIFNTVDIGSNFGNAKVEEQCYAYIQSRIYDWLRDQTE